MAKEVKTLLWLDDIRNPYTGSWLHDFAPEYEIANAVSWAKDYDEFVDWITKNGLPDKIAFDHDLGEDIAIEMVKKGINKKQAREIKKTAKSGMDCARWLVDYCMDNNKDLPSWVVQSANPVGADNINGLLLGYLKHSNK